MLEPGPTRRRCLPRLLLGVPGAHGTRGGSCHEPGQSLDHLGVLPGCSGTGRLRSRRTDLAVPVASPAALIAGADNAVRATRDELVIASPIDFRRSEHPIESFEIGTGLGDRRSAPATSPSPTGRSGAPCAFERQRLRRRIAPNCRTSAPASPPRRRTRAASSTMAATRTTSVSVHRSIRFLISCS